MKVISKLLGLDVTVLPQSLIRSLAFGIVTWVCLIVNCNVAVVAYFPLLFLQDNACFPSMVDVSIPHERPKTRGREKGFKINIF